MPSAWDKFLLLSWKNWIIQLRHPIQTLFEVLVPVLVCTLLLLIRGLVDIEEIPESRFAPFSTNFIGGVRLTEGVTDQLAYSPQNPVLQSLVSRVSLELDFPLPVEARESSLDLENWASIWVPFASIEFEDSLKVRWWNFQRSLAWIRNSAFQDITELPPVINYALRFPSELRTNNSILARLAPFTEHWSTNFRISSGPTVGPRNRFSADGGTPPGYIFVRRIQ